jgi:hypothetical protein
MNRKSTLVCFFLFLSIGYPSIGQVIIKSIPENSQVPTLEGKTFQVLLFAKNYLDSATLDLIKNDPYNSFQQPLTNNRVVLNFKNGSLETSWVADKKFEACTAPLITENGNLIAFTTNCNSPDPDVKAIWSGIVKRSSIQGTFCWQLPDGKLICYAFYGSESRRDKEPDEKSDKITLLNK